MARGGLTPQRLPQARQRALAAGAGYSDSRVAAVIMQMFFCSHRSEPGAVETGTLTLSRRQLPVGTERYTVTREKGGLVLRPNIGGQSRGVGLEQTAELRMAQEYTPRRFSIKGNIYSACRTEEV